MNTFGAYQAFEVQQENQLLKVGFNYGEMNLMDSLFLTELQTLIDTVKDHPSIKVVLFYSLNPSYFIAHFDVQQMSEAIGRGLWKKDRNQFIELLQKIRQSSTIFVAQVSGRARGAGCEFISALDMVYASEEKARFAQPEITLGITPAGGALNDLKKKVGYQRAMELLTTGADIDAITAEKYGLITRCVPDLELNLVVQDLLQKICHHPSTLLAQIKTSLGQSSDLSVSAQNEILFDCFLLSDAGERVRHFLSSGGQTYTSELEEFSNLVGDL